MGQGDEELERPRQYPGTGGLFSKNKKKEQAEAFETLVIKEFPGLLRQSFRHNTHTRVNTLGTHAGGSHVVPKPVKTKMKRS